MTNHTDPTILRDRIMDVLEFYYPTCIDERGGYIAQLDETTGRCTILTPGI